MGWTKTQTEPQTESTTVSSIFRPSRSATSSYSNLSSKKKSKTRSWSCNVFCFAESNAYKVLTASEKILLQKSSLGSKRIQFLETDTEHDVKSKLMSVEGFPLLRMAGGFELLNCLSNSKHIQVINCKWDVKSLRGILGSQCKLYIRPIQNDLPLKMDFHAEENGLREKCNVCNLEYSISGLREHVEVCKVQRKPQDTEIMTSVEVDIPSSTEIELPSVENDETAETQPTVLFDDVFNVNETSSISPGQEENVMNFMESSSLQVIVNDPNASTELVENTISASLNVTVNDIVLSCINFCNLNNITDPIQILRIYQKEIVTGRKLDLESEDTTIEGDTNFIMVDRNNLIESGFIEVENLTDLRPCLLEVQFSTEGAIHYRGPRKAFFAEILRQIKEKYFDPVKEWFGREYETVGKIKALSTVQNGKLPRLRSQELLEEVFVSNNPRPIIVALRKGLDALGLYQLACGLPYFIHLFTPVTTPLTVKSIISSLQLSFSEQGSNRQRKETSLYQKFVQYLCEVAIFPCLAVRKQRMFKPFTKQQNLGCDHIESICSPQIEHDEITISLFDGVQNTEEKGENDD